MAYHDKRSLDPSFTFWALNVLQRAQVSGAVLVASRNNALADEETMDEPVTVQQLREVQAILEQQEWERRTYGKTSSEIDRSVTKHIFGLLNRLSPYFTSVKGTLPYMVKKRQDLFSMLKHTAALPVKVPTWFATLSAADYYWPEVFQAIDPSLSLEQINNLPLVKKIEMVRRNPRIVATIFYERFKALRKYIFNGRSKPLGKLTDWFFRFEWQLRDAIHVHMLLYSRLGLDWEKLLDSEEGRHEISQLIDAVISTMLPGEEEEGVEDP